jgi:hypothetical protein
LTEAFAQRYAQDQNENQRHDQEQNRCPPITQQKKKIFLG